MYSGFFSDNCAGVLPEIMNSLISENNGFSRPYGHDQTTEEAKKILKKHLGDAEVNFMLTGTGANVALIASVLRPFQGVICTDTAHINVDECGAPERFTSCKLLTVPSYNGKLTPDDITRYAAMLLAWLAARNQRSSSNILLNCAATKRNLERSCMDCLRIYLKSLANCLLKNTAASPNIIPAFVPPRLRISTPSSPVI